MFNDYDMWKLSEPDYDERLRVVAICESCGEEIFAGDDTYWIEVKGMHQLRFCTREEAREYVYKMGANPDYVSWIEADNYENQIESDDNFVNIEESWG